ncbi:hypothetical protein [Pedobacter sp. MW01-1-1]|uniref:hypothetical protein n=1 Tax=Pedobacter sp. MW01-1-1 TaxID=3383027 RepID=UPI003FF0F681
MSKVKFKTILGRGVALAIPLGVVLYVFAKIIGVLQKVIAPLAAKLGIDRIWGELTLFILTIVIIVLIILLLGLLMQVAFVSVLKNQVEEIILKFVPSLNQLKLMAADGLDYDEEENKWTPVLVKMIDKGSYHPAFIIEEDENLVTLFLCYDTALKKGQILTYEKNQVELKPVGYLDLKRASREAGKGYIALLNNK